MKKKSFIGSATELVEGNESYTESPFNRAFRLLLMGAFYLLIAKFFCYLNRGGSKELVVLL